MDLVDSLVIETTGLNKELDRKISLIAEGLGKKCKSIRVLIIESKVRKKATIRNQYIKISRNATNQTKKVTLTQENIPYKRAKR